MPLSLAGCASLLPDAPPADDAIAALVRHPAPVPPPVAPRPPAEPATQPPPAGPPASQPEAARPQALRVTVEQAIVTALERNAALRVQRLGPSLARTFEQEERAVFDADLSIEASDASAHQPSDTRGHERTNEPAVSVGLSQTFPTGTDVSAELSTEAAFSNLSDDSYLTRVGLTVNQALLRGAGLDVNLASVRQARLDTLASEYELRGYAEALVAETESAYWDTALAQRTIEIVNNSLKLAEQQLAETRERVTVGQLAETELAAPEAELARRREDLIDARSNLATNRLNLLRLLNPDRGDNGFWSADVALGSLPAAPAIALDDVEVHVQVALRMRPDLNQARLGVQRGDLELVKTRNGLLPRLDLFITLGLGGYARSFGSGSANVGRGDYDLLAGVRFEVPPANRSAEARHQRAAFSREQAARAVANLEQVVQLGVRSAYIEVGRAREQVAATAATRRFQEATLKAETEKFHVGKSTSILVAQAQRDLLASQIAEVEAVVNLLKALINLHLEQGALLERRGITAPGAAPVEATRPRRW